MSQQEQVQRRIRAASFGYGRRTNLTILLRNLEFSELPTIDPESLAMLACMRMCGLSHSGYDFTYDGYTGAANDFPSFPNAWVNKRLYLSVDELQASTKFDLSLNTICWDTNDDLARRDTIINAIAQLKRVCICGLSLLQPFENSWVVRAGGEVYDENELKVTMENCCEVLNGVLRDHQYILDNVEDRLSYLDAKLLGAGIVIYKCFRGGGNHYCLCINSILKKNIHLWAYFERLHGMLFTNFEYNPFNCSPMIEQDTTFLSRMFKEENLIEGYWSNENTTRVYTLSYHDANNLNLNLPERDYIVKRSMNTTLMEEVHRYNRLPYKMFVRPMAYGYHEWNDATGRHGEGFIIFPRMMKGSLTSNLEELDWSKAIKWSYQIAYAMFLIHTSKVVLCNIHPSNIMIDHEDNVLMYNVSSIRDEFENAGHSQSVYQDPNYTEAL